MYAIRSYYGFKETDMKTTVKLRVKKLADGNGSYYLDWFQNGKRHYEYLKIYGFDPLRKLGSLRSPDVFRRTSD